MFLALAALTVMVKTSADPVALTHQYKEGQTLSFKISVDVDAGGQTLSLGGTINEKVKKLLEKGEADVEVTVTDVKAPDGFGGGTAPAAQTMKADSHGMFVGAKFKEMEAMIAIVGVASYVPVKPVAVGESFPIEWKSTDYASSGKGTIKEIKEVDGKKIAVVTTKVDVTPTDDSPATLEFTSEFDLATGVLLKAEGTAKSDQFNASVKITPAKAA